jgi:hypothetical protein
VISALEVTITSLSSGYISPDGNGTRDTTMVSFTVSEACTLTIELRSTPGGSLLETLLSDSSLGPGAHGYTWNGRGPGSAPFADAAYNLAFSARTGPSAAFADTTVHVDVTKPALIATFGDTLHPGVTYKNGETIRFSTSWDSEMEEVTADFSAVDTRYVTGSEFVQSDLGGGYLIIYNVSVDNERVDGYNIPITISAMDSAGNSTVGSYKVSLRNGMPTVAGVTVLDEDIVYRNGDSVRVSTSWSSTIGIQTVDLDLSSIDSFFSGSKVKHARTSDTSFVSSYKMTTTNSRIDGSYIVSATGIDSAGAQATVDTIRMILDNSPPGGIVLGAYPVSVRTDSVSLNGTTTEPGNVHVLRGSQEVASGVTGAGNLFQISVPLVPKENTLELYTTDLAGNSSDTLTISVVRVATGTLEIDIDAPFGRDGQFKLFLPKTAGSVTIEIYSLSANMIVTLVSAGAQDNYVIPWDGTNTAGELVNSGPLLAKISVEYPDGEVQRKTVPFLFRR